MSSNADGSSRRPTTPGRNFRPGSLDDDDLEGDTLPPPTAPGPGPVAREEGGSAPTPSETASAVPARPADSVVEDSPLGQNASRCVLMGPSKAGKTSLLLAFDQACSCPVDGADPFRLEFIGGQKGTAKLAKLGILTIMKEKAGVEPTMTTEEVYEASVTATREKTLWQPARQSVAHLSFRDGPGGALFPVEEKDGYYFKEFLAPWEKNLLKDARQAETLVLCVDATNPQPDIVTRYMREILAELGQTYHRRRDEPMGYRLLRKMHLAHEVPRLLPERRIRATRFLLLLTKIDQLVGFEPEWSEQPGPTFVAPTPKYLAERKALTRAISFENEQRVMDKDGRYRWFRQELPGRVGFAAWRTRCPR